MTTTSSYAGLSDSSLLSDYISSQNASTASSTSSSDTLWGDYDTFLNILTTQLKNQDPTEPTDVSEFTAQLVQYAEVEQQINTNDKLDEILSTMDSNGITPLLNYVGTYVEAPTTNKILVQNGAAIFSYNLEEKAESVEIEVMDSSGEVVATLQGSTNEGTNRIVWDGVMDNDEKIDDGSYKFKLTATDEDGKTFSATDFYVTGCVTGIETNDDGDVVMKLDDLEIQDENIDGVWPDMLSAMTSSDGLINGGSGDTDSSESDSTTTSDDTASSEEATTTEES